MSSTTWKLAVRMTFKQTIALTSLLASWSIAPGQAPSRFPASGQPTSGLPKTTQPTSGIPGLNPTSQGQQPFGQPSNGQINRGQGQGQNLGQATGSMASPNNSTQIRQASGTETNSGVTPAPGLPAPNAGIQGFNGDGGLLMALQPQPAPPLAFEDQFSKNHRIQDFQGDILVLIYGDRASADANRALGETIHLVFHPGAKGKQAGAAKETPPLLVQGQPRGARTPDVHAVPVAVIGRVPSFARGLIQNRFKAAVSDTSVWLDFDDRLKSTWGIVDGQPNVVVVDSRSRGRTKGNGKLNTAQVQQLVDTIEVLRREALGLK